MEIINIRCKKCASVLRVLMETNDNNQTIIFVEPCEYCVKKLEKLERDVITADLAKKYQNEWYKQGMRDERDKMKAKLEEVLKEADLLETHYDY